MIFAFTTLLAALSLAAVADWFSIIGFMAIYAAAPMHALIMGIVLALAKVVTTSWVYRNWEFSDWKLKTPLIGFVVALMITTSIGTFGFLSKAHLEQGASTIDNSAKVERLDQQIAREKATIADDEKVISQLDATINSYIGKDKTDKSLAVRRSQAPQRKQLRDDIDAAQKRIDGYSDEKLKLQSEVRKQQLDVGPIRYIAELFYGVAEDSTKNIEAAVRLFTLLIVSTLDPLAVILLVAANHTLLRLRNEKDKKIVEEGVPVDPRDGAGNQEKEHVEESCQTDSSHQDESHENPVREEASPVAPIGSEEIHPTAGEVPLPVLSETLCILDEEISSASEKSDRNVPLPGEMATSWPSPSEVCTEAVVSTGEGGGEPTTDRQEEEVQEVDNEEKNHILEPFSKGSNVAPLSTGIRTPRLTRVHMSEKAALENEVQEPMTPHFIPQKVTDESPSTSLNNANREADSNKYPVTLSWLAEFKKV